MNNQIKEEGLTDAYLLGKYDGIKQGRAEAINSYKQELKQDINCRLKSVEKYLEGETLDAWRQATRTFKDAIDYFAEQLKEQNNVRGNN